MIADAAWRAAERLLPTFRDPDGDHEGIVFALGRPTQAETTIVTTIIAPQASSAPGRVHCDEQQMLGVTQTARTYGLLVVAQIHSHPGAGTEHSIGDDTMVFLPREGLLSIVVPHYGHHGLRPISTLGVHQFQDGRWIRAEGDSVRDHLVLVPDYLDLR